MDDINKSSKIPQNKLMYGVPLIQYMVDGNKNFKMPQK